MAKSIGYGAVLTTGTSTGGFVVVGQVQNISGPSVSANDVDTTCMDSSSNYRTFTCGLLDPGELTFSVVYDSTSASHSCLVRNMNKRLTTNWSISVAGDSPDFNGYVKGMSREIPMDGLITCDVTVKVTGTPGYTT